LEIHNGGNSALIESISIADAGRVTIAGSTVTIDPSANFVLGQSYYVVMPSGVIKDLAGNDFVGLVSPSKTWFTATTAFDPNSPTLTATSPVDDSQSAPIGANIVLTFNESVRAGAGYVEIRKTSDGSLVSRISVSDGSQVTFFGNVMTVNPAGDFSAGTDYYVTLPSGVIIDLSGNPYAGILTTAAFNFRTVRQTAFDFNGDAHSDILWQNTGGQVSIWTLNGVTPIGASLVGPNPGTAWHARRAGDFNGDGKADILWQGDNGQVAIWTLDGFTPLGASLVGGSPDPAWQGKDTGDFNGDGKADILWQNTDGRVSIWLMDGFTPLGASLVGANPGPAWHVIGSGDFNGDGKSDILWQHDSGQVSIWLMDGLTPLGGSFVGANPNTSWHIRGTGDFNGDGKSDILWQHDNGQVSIWLMDSYTPLGASLVGSNPGPAWQVKGVGDFNGDGMADILWQNTNGQVSIWTMNGLTPLSGGLVGPNPGTSWTVIATLH